MPKKETEVLCKIVCSRCGKEDYVPFVADGSRNYYCNDCLRKFNTERKRGVVKEFTDAKGNLRFEFICDVCEKFLKDLKPPKRVRGKLICAECAEKEQRERRSASRKRIVIAKKED